MTAAAPRTDRLFYTGMALTLLVVAVAGFASTFYRRPADLPPLPLVVLMHGLLGTAWLALFALQTMLVAAGSREWHRRLGTVGAGLTLLFVATGVPLVSRFEGLHGEEPLRVLAPHLFTNVAPLVAFAVLAGAGVWQRNVATRHKRFMLLAAVVLSPPAIGRLFAELDLARFNLLAYAGLAFANSLYDWIVRGRPHAITLVGAAALVAIDVITTRWLAAVGF
jgi:uncharacterized membrane protein YozB (DUF420 family)